MQSIPNGVYPTMITPYTTDDKIDFNAVEQVLTGITSVMSPVSLLSVSPVKCGS